MKNNSVSISKQELTDAVNSYLMYSIRKQIPPAPSYSSNIYKEDLIKKQFENLIELIFDDKNSDKNMSMPNLLKFYALEIELNRKISKDYESRETLVPKSKFEELIWSFVNIHFSYFTAEMLYPVPEHVIKGVEQDDKAKAILTILFFIGLIICYFFVF